MPFDIISRLRQVTPEQRGEILNATYKKNKNFFKEFYPVINQYLENNSSCPYRIDMTETFLNIVHNGTNEVAHPTAGLDVFAEMLGGWTHKGWHDLFNLRVVYPGHECIHQQIVKDMFARMGEKFPDHNLLWDRGILNLKDLAYGKKFSPPVVFLGIFHGLHIAHLFDTTVFTDAVFLEPDPDRFEVSCYFLDYQEVVERLGSFHIYVGSDVVGRHFARFFNDYSVTQHMWVRVLPAYPSEKNPYFIEAVKSLMSTRSDTIFAHDDHVRGMKNACTNISKHLPLLTKRPKLSKKSSIAVVASGPSLSNDLQWLKKNQNNLLVFSVHSAVRILKKNGIKPDLQFSLDALLDKETFQKLDLFEDVPLINNYKVGGAVTDLFENLLLVTDQNGADAVKMTCPLQCTTPSSTNLAFSFACFCNPREVYLLGCDMGFRSVKESHVVGHHNEGADEKADLYKLASQLYTQPNFSYKTPIQTTPFLNASRMAIEYMLSEVKGKVNVVNLSDGALIDGAKAKVSSHVKVPQYKRKKQDLDQIFKAFVPLKKNVNWKLFPKSGAEVLRSLKDHFLANLQLDEFDWAVFSRQINSALFSAMESCGQKMESDYRMSIYNKLFLDLLCTWYIYIILRDNNEDAERVYREGYATIKALVDTLEWPAGLEPNA